MAIAEDPKRSQRTELDGRRPRSMTCGRRCGEPAASSRWSSSRRAGASRRRRPPLGAESLRAAPAQRPVRDRLRARGGLRGRDRPRARAGRVRVRLRAPRRPAAQVGRGLHRAPGRGGADLREHAPGHRDAVRGAAARHRRGHLGLDRGGARALRRGDRRDRRRRHQADRDHLPVARRGAGRTTTAR